MPLRHGYGVLKGVVTDYRAATTSETPHFQIELQADGELFHAAVNVRSKGARPALLFFVDEDFKHPLTEVVAGLPRGFHPLESQPESGALDYLRGNLFPWGALKELPHGAAAQASALNEKLESLVRRAGDGRTAVYIFGEPWGPEPGSLDDAFKFEAGRGIHDIHMNQGNPGGPFWEDNGAYQDGALLFQFANENRWTAVFLAFATQANVQGQGGGPGLGEPRNAAREMA